MAALASCGRKDAPPPPLPPVTFAVAASESVPYTIRTFGNCVSIANVTLQAQVTGTLVRYAAAQGAKVKAGDLIAEIDPSPFQAALSEAQGNLDAARAQLANAEVNLTRQQQLYKTKTNDLADLQNAEANQLQAQGQVLTAEGQLADAQINLGFCTIKAPADGVVGIYLVDAGNLVTANETKLVTVQTIDPIYVDFTISENQFATVREYLSSGPLQVLASLPSAPDSHAEGRLTVVNNQVDTATGTLMLRATFPNATGLLWPGLFVDVSLILKTLENAVTVPSECVMIGQDGPYVFVIGSDNAVKFTPVALGPKRGGFTVIAQGVSAGDRVVTAGQLGLVTGARVTPAPWKAPKDGVSKQ